MAWMGYMEYGIEHLYGCMVWYELWRAVNENNVVQVMYDLQMMLNEATKANTLKK